MLSPGDVVTVQIVSVDAERSRIALAWAEEDEPEPAAPALVPEAVPEENPAAE